MEENELYDRIGETDLNPTYKDGQPYMHTDINQMLGILKTAINENYYDIQRLLNGVKTVGNANKLDEATLSRYIDEELQSDDNKIPSSQQAKAYMDALFAGYSAPVRGVDYWTEADQQQIVSDTASNVIEEITPDLEEALNAKANINDVPTKVSDLTNDSEFITKSVDNLDNYYDKTEVDNLAANKVNKNDIIDNLTSEEIQKPLSANQGRILSEKIEKVKYIFPNNSSYTTEYTIIKAYGKNILIDCGDWHEYENLKSSLINNNVEHIDIFIASHYHGDHVGNFTDLVTDGYIDNETLLYLPTFNTTTWANNSAYQHYTNAMNTISQHNYSYITPIENQVIEINENFNITIFNTNDTYYIDNNLSDDYNNASIMCLIKHYDINTLLTGDCKAVAINKIYNEGKIPNTVHIYKIGHHGIDTLSNSDNDVIRNCQILNTIQIVGINDLAQGKVSSSEGNMLLADISNVFITCYNKGNIVLSSSNNMLSLINGFSNGGSEYLGGVERDLYVDVNSNLYQNGSEDYPFSNLLQAIGFIKRNTGYDYVIHVADGSYEQWLPNSYYSVCSITNTNNKIHIVGNSSTDTVVKFPFRIKNCQNVIIENIKIENATVSRGIDIYASNVILKNIVYDAENQSSLQRAINIENQSNVIIDTASINYASYGIYEENSNLDINNITFENISSFCMNFNGGNINSISGITVNDSSQVYKNNTNKPVYSSGFELLSATSKFNDNISHTIALLTSAKNFRALEIGYTINGFIGFVKHNIQSGDNKIGINTHHLASTSASYYSSRIDLSNSSSCNYTYSRKLLYDITTGTFTYSEDIDTFQIISIKGY